MIRTEAHNILDAAQRGELVTKALITEALQVTGDLARYEPKPTARTSLKVDAAKPPAWMDEVQAFDEVRA